MKVGELISTLQDLDENLEVHLGYNYGDHARTTVAPKVRKVEEDHVKWSNYHNMPAVVRNDDEPEDEAEGTLVVILQ